MEQAGSWGGGGEEPGRSGGPAAPDATPGQLRVEARSRAHAMGSLADAVAETHRAIASCRDDPSWSGSAHDAYVRALDDLAGRVALAATLLHDARAEAGSAPGCPGVRP